MGKAEIDTESPEGNPGGILGEILEILEILDTHFAGLEILDAQQSVWKSWTPTFSEDFFAQSVSSPVRHTER
jgi:hypothetical protein